MAARKTTEILLLVLLQITFTLVHCKLECAVDERPLQLQLSPTPTYKILRETYEIATETDCYESCCNLRNKSNDCNAASFFKKDDGTTLCLNIQCMPFSNCIWESSFGGHSAKIALFDADTPDENKKVDFNSDDVEDGIGVTHGTSEEESSGEEPEEEDELEQLEEEEEEEELEQEEAMEALFDDMDEDDQWNVEYFEPTTTLDYGGEEPAKPTHPKTHGNSGIYGPTEVYDFDYATTPLIVIGGIVTVLLMLVILICVGRKLSKSERLKYRPLRDSFPANNATTYHDID